jgi:hypothetical protein
MRISQLGHGTCVRFALTVRDRITHVAIVPRRSLHVGVGFAKNREGGPKAALS